MSVLLGDRKESKFEAITYSIELHDMLIDLMRRSFGVKDVDHFVRRKYAYGDIKTEDFAYYRHFMYNFKSGIDKLASQMTNNIRGANSIYLGKTTTPREYEIRQEYQLAAIANCEQLMKELQRVVEIFDVDINLYARYVKAIDREIDLIKHWRRNDKRLKPRS